MSMSGWSDEFGVGIPQSRVDRRDLGLEYGVDRSIVSDVGLADSRSQYAMTCPTCGAEAELVVDGECAECADGRTAEWIRRLQPE